MESLVSIAANFSPQYILNLGQLDILSRFDSFGDIPGHGEIFLGRKILWTLKSNLVLFWMSFAVLYKIYTRGKWSEMPMDVIRQLSVTFPDCSESSVLDAATVVTATSYSFTTGEKQHGSLVTFFVEQYEKVLFRGVYFVCKFLSSDNYLEFQNLRAEGRRFGGKIFSVSLVSLNRISSQILFWTSQFFSLSINIFSISTFRQIFSLCNASSWVCQLVVPVLLLRTASIPSHQYFQDSKFMTCFTFSEYFAIMFFFLYFISFPKGLTKPVPEE